MKLEVVLALCMLRANGAFAAPTPLVQLSSNQSVYHVGQRATLTAEISVLEQNSGDEVLLTGELGGVQVALVSQNVAAEIYETAAFSMTGALEWTVTVRTRNRALADGFIGKLVSYRKDLFQARQSLQSATAPTEIALLRERVSSDQSAIASLQQRLAQITVMREVDSLPISVQQ